MWGWVRLRLEVILVIFDFLLKGMVTVKASL